MAVHELPDPTAGPGEVLIAVSATGICGSDIHGFTGENGRRVPGQVMGHESEGRVADLGPGAEGRELRIGQRVTFNPVVLPEADAERYEGREQHSPNKYVVGVRTDLVSSFAQFITMPVRNVVPLPENLPEGYGALIEPMAVAVHAVRRVGVRAGNGVLVVGGGPIGQSVVLALRMAGVERVVVSEVDAARRALNHNLGATVVNPASGPLLSSVVASLGDLADLSIDAVGSRGTLDDCLSACRLGGSVCLVGMGAKRVEFDAYAVSTQERTIVGSFTYSAKDFEDAAAWISAAPTEAAHLITREVTLAEANTAFRSLADRDGTPGKVLVRLDS